MCRNSRFGQSGQHLTDTDIYNQKIYEEYKQAYERLEQTLTFYMEKTINMGENYEE